MITHPLGLRAVNRVTRERFRRHCRPLPRLTMSQWAEKHRVLSPEASAQHGPWRNDVAPYLVEVMDTLGDRGTQEVTFVAPSQSGKSEVLLNAIGYFIHQEPSPIILVQPTVETGESFSKDRIAPMLRDSPVLSTLVSPARSRDSNNTIASKALALDTPIPTPSGWTTMGGVNVGDVVFDERGNPCNVIDVSPIYLDHACYRVRFSDGAEIIADAGHRWAVEWWRVVKQDGVPTQTNTCGILTTEEIARSPGIKGRHRFAIRVAAALDLPHSDLPVDPYVLGAWLGDGFSHRAWVCAGEKDAPQMAANLSACGVSVTYQKGKPGSLAVMVLDRRDTTRRTERGQFHKATEGVGAGLHALGLLGKTGDSRKAIPAIYLRSSREQRLALLQGLMDTDGSVQSNGMHCKFVTTCPAIGEPFKELLSSLGLVYSLRMRQPMHSRKGASVRKPGKLAYDFAFYPPPEMPVFRLPRKIARQIARPSLTTKATRRRVVAVEQVPSVAVRCISVDSSSHLYLAGRQMIPTHNSYPGGQLDIAGANAPAGLAMRPKRFVGLDERDRHPRSAGKEGDVKSITRARTRSYRRRRKIYEVSSPTDEETSLIWSSYLEGTQEVWEVPCPACGHFQTLHFERLEWTLDEAGKVDLETVAYKCASCQGRIAATERGPMIRAGRWTATAQARVPYKRSFRLHGLCAAFASWEEIAQEFVTANGQQDPAIRADKLRAFFNTTLGELYKDQQKETAKAALLLRAKAYAAGREWHVPREAALISVGVDLQHDRGELVVRAYGIGEESWLIERAVLRGDTSQPGWWVGLEEYRTKREWRHEGGAMLRVRATAIDAGDGTHAKTVYQYCAPRLGQHVYAVKGSNNPSAPMIPTKPTKVKPGRLYVIGVNAIMDRMYRRLGMVERGPGYMHMNEWCDEDYATQVLSMRRVVDAKTRKRRWEATPNVRNEVPDAEGYCYAAFLLGPVPLTLMAAEVERVNAEGKKAVEPEKPNPVVVAAHPPQQPRQRGGFVRRF